MSPARRRPLVAEVARLYPSLDDPESAIRAGLVTVAGRFVDNPASLVAPGEPVNVRDEAPLRGEAKLAAALDHFGVDPTGRVALDAGASTGGFVRVLLARGARRVYAVEAGHGQLLGSLRQDERVVNLEGTNLGQLDRTLVPNPVGLVTLDLSYLALSAAAPQLAALDLAPGADAVVLVKPMFELGLATAPTDASVLPEAVERAAQGFIAAGWLLEGWIPSPVTGARGAVEALMHARR